MEKMNLVSGMRSTGKLHLGHYMGVITNWVKLQEDYNCFYFVADWHALTTKYDKTETLKQDKLDVVLDWLACGIDPNKSVIYFQSKVLQIAELHILLSMITPNNWVERDPTLKDMVKILKSKEGENNENIPQMSYGLLGYPVLMSADIMALNAQVVPVGVDQLAHLEITRDIARRFNNIYKTDYFKEPAPKLTKIPLLKGLDGNKMGKSFNNDIKISDSEEITQKKINTGITDRNRIRKDDKGNPDNCEVIFDYWKIFGSNEEVNQICCDCKNAKIGCAQCKKMLANKVNQTLAPIREKRLELQKDSNYIKDVIIEGSKKAKIEAQIVMNGVIEAVKMYH